MGKTRFYAVLCVLLVFFAGCGGGGGENGGNASANGATSENVSTADGAGTGSTTSNDTANGAILTLAWGAPADVDGTPLADIAGFRIYYGTEPGVYTSSVDVGTGTTYSFGSLPPGAYFFAVSDYDSSGNESGFSNEVTKTIL